ncbi:MAG: hypothetical protein Q9174_001640 [Haloplaca sp. 1 TL-2023]
MDPVSIIIGLLGIVGPTIHAIRIARAHLKKVRRDKQAAGDLLDQLEVLQSSLESLKTLVSPEPRRLFSPTSSLVTNTRSCENKLNLLCEQLKEAEKGHSKFYWPLSPRDHDDTLQELKDMVQWLQFAVSIDGVTILSKTSDEVIKIFSHQLKIFQLIHELNQRTEASSRTILDIEDRLVASDAVLHRKNVLDWLSHISLQETHNRIRALHTHGTSQWLFRDPAFQRWKDQPLGYETLLWCHGPPGSGKTVLVFVVHIMICLKASVALTLSRSEIIEHLRQDEGAGIAYIYFDYQAQMHWSLEDITASLLKQLASAQSKLPGVLNDFWNDFKAGSSTADRERLLKTLLLTSKAFAKTYVVVDALDECDEYTRNGFLKLVGALQIHSRVLVASRDFQESIINAFWTSPQIKINADSSDIRSYVLSTISESGYPKAVSSPLRDEIASKITQRSQSMFLLATFQLEMVLAAPTAGAMEDALDGLPESLEKAFGESMKRIGSQTPDRKDIALQCLKWMTYAKSPLSADALGNALAMRKDKPTARSEYRPSLPTIVDCCQGLVSTDEHGQDVRLVHSSVHGYILSRERDFPLRSESALAQLCVAHMMMEPFVTPAHRTRIEVLTLLHDHPFMRYAALQWGHHVRAAPIDATTNKAVLDFLSAKGPRTCACQIRAFLRPGLRQWDLEEASTCSDLHVAAMFGLSDIARQLLSTCTVNEQTHSGTTALMHTCQNGHVGMVQLLVDNGADINMTDRFGTALHHAAEAGHVPVIRQLLHLGLDPNIQDPDGRTPLFYAARAKQCEAIRELIDSHAKIDHVCPGKGTALQVVVRSSPSPDVVRLLLQCKADPNLPAPIGMPLLHEVALDQTGDEVLNLLLEYRSDVNLGFRDGLTALMVATNNNKLHFMRRLLDSGANVNAVTFDGYTALHLAAPEGLSDAVKLLLQYGAALDLPGSNIKKPLHLAAKYNRVEIVHVLLEAGADLKSCMKTDGTLLDVFLENDAQAAYGLLVEWQAKKDSAAPFAENKSAVVVPIESNATSGA